jgi:hypothetical protein
MDHTPYLSVSILICRTEAHPGSLRITARAMSSRSDFDFMIISQAVHTGLKPQVPRLVPKWDRLLIDPKEKGGPEGPPAEGIGV